MARHPAHRHAGTPAGRRCLRRWLPAVLAACALGPATGCSDDEPMAAYCQALVELKTSADGYVRRLVTDDGTTLTVTNRPGSLRPDTTYRATALYVRQSADEVVLHGVSSVPSPLPARYAAESVHTDPVRLDAAWRGGRYLNLRITLQTDGQPHVLGFIERGITDNPDGTRTLCVGLYHDQHCNALYYPREVTLSCPLWPYADRLRAGSDSVRIAVATFDGTVERTFPY